MELKVDPDRDITRNEEYEPMASGILVRALRDGVWGNADIFELDEYSLREWVNSRGMTPEWAMQTIMILLWRRWEIE